jgi:hypothetical protein
MLARRGVPMTLAFAISCAALATPASAVITPSWNGYRWARTGPLAIKTVDRTSSAWTPYFKQALTGWSAASQLDLVGSRGTYNPTCRAAFATIQVCNGNYGNNGWLGYANVWTMGGRIVQATVRLNDTYFNQSRYNTPAWRASTMCQELGHTIGLAHNNTNRGDTNTGSCMDYSNDPDGGGFYGKSNLTPGSMDFAGLNIIYKNLDKNQLPGTKLKLSSEALTVPGFGGHDHDHDHDHGVGTVPEPGSWLMLIAGFGMTGAVVRRARRAAMASSALLPA